ncbi:hypothetical protein INT47_003837 [Mucor saturninus]|uniref:Uncharacterized protein n=1 Tax=Mucor saturninus TaxID=64648 RepID=A0A8H7QGG9_9FUNG|nr:hypothetical protein INT47_003837 [Mucor saturninus]
MSFSSLRLLNSHYQRYPDHRVVDTDVIMQEAELPSSSVNTPLSTDSVPYHSSFTFEAGHGEKHVYDFGPDPSFDETELNSIQFMDIIETYGISREASRELIYLFRTILQNNLIGAEFKNGKVQSTILFQDTLERRLAAKVDVRSHVYDICLQGCRLYQKNDDETLDCSSCGEQRYANVMTRRPARQMKMMSVGDRIASVLANDRFRELMKYRHNYQYEDDVYKDYFDGEEYRSLKANTNFFSSEDDVALFFSTGSTLVKQRQATNFR